MANPFDSRNFPGSPTADPYRGGASAFANAAKPGRAYSGLTDPSQGGLPGLIGSFMGSPTRQDVRSRTQGGIYEKLAQALQRGVPANQAIIQVMNTPEGMEFFQNATPESIKGLQDFVASQVPAAPEPFQSTGPGERAFNPNEGTYGPAGDTTNTLDHKQMLEMAGIAPGTTLYQAMSKVAATSGSNSSATEKERNWDVAAILAKTDEERLWFIENKPLYIAEIIKVSDMKDDMGNTTGTKVFNIQTQETRVFWADNEQPILGTGAGTPQVQPGMAGPSQEDVVGDVFNGPQVAQGGVPQMPAGSVPPEQNNAPAVNREPRGGYFGTIEGAEVPADIADEAGFVNWAKSAGGGIAGQWASGLSGQDAKAKENAINAIKLDLRVLFGAGKSSNEDLKPLNELVELSMGMNELQLAQQLLDMRKQLEDTAYGLRDISTDPALSDDFKKDIEARFYNIRMGLMHVPPAPFLEKYIEVKAKDPRGAARKIWDNSKELMQEGEDAIQGLTGSVHHFGSIEEAEAAIAAGDMAEGDTVTIEGMEDGFTVGEVP